MVPNGWMQKKFGEVTSIGNGQVDPKIEPYLSMIHIGPENVVSNTGQIINIKSCKDSDLISGKYEFDENAIVYSKIRPNLNKVCKPDFNGVCSADMYPIWVNRDDLHKDYLFHYMLGPQFYKAAIAMSMRTGMPKINRNDLNTLNILLPPLAEQQKIAQILSTWDKAIAVTEQLLANSQQQKKALMQQLLTSKKRLLDENGARFEGEWRKGMLGDITIIDSGFAFKSIDFTESEEGIPVIRMSDFKNGEINTKDSAKISIEIIKGLDRYKLKVGDFIFGMSGSLNNYGWVSEKDIPCYLNQRVGRILSKDNSNQIFIAYLYLSDMVQKTIIDKAAGAAHLNISIKDLREIKVCYPSKNEQQKIAVAINTAAKEIEALQRKLDCLQQEKKALMQQLLTGKRRVKVAA